MTWTLHMLQDVCIAIMIEYNTSMTWAWLICLEATHYQINEQSLTLPNLTMMLFQL